MIKDLIIDITQALYLKEILIYMIRAYFYFGVVSAIVMVIFALEYNPS